MPPHNPTKSPLTRLSSRQHTILLTLLANQSITPQTHDLDSLIHILLVRMQGEGWTIDSRGRLVMPPSRNERLRRGRHVVPPREVAVENEEVAAGREGVENTHVAVAVKFERVDRERVKRVESARREGYNSLLKGKGKKREEPGEEDGDPHFIAEDAVFEFWLRDIWDLGRDCRVRESESVEGREKNMENMEGKEESTEEEKKNQFSDLWRGLCGGKGRILM